MKRHAALASLSRDHHQALFVAQTLSRATERTADDARHAFLAFWRDEREHFRLEEEVLLPAFARHGDPYGTLVARTLCDHVDLRQRAHALAGAGGASIDELHELGFRLRAHVRLEERELFPLIERTLTDDALSALAAVLTGLEAADG